MRSLRPAGHNFGGSNSARISAIPPGLVVTYGKVFAYNIQAQVKASRLGS